MSTPKSFMIQHFKGLALTLAAICLLGTSVAAQPGNLYNTSTGAGSGPTDAAAGIQITNQASMSYTFATVATNTSSNTVSVYVNQIDAFYLAANDTGLAGTTVYSQRDFVTGAAVAIVALNTSIVNLSNGPIKLTFGVDAKGALGTALTPFLAGATYQSTGYSFTATGSGVATSGSTVGSTITIQQNSTATLIVTVTASVSDEFVTTLTDVTVTSGANAGSYTVTKYISGSPLWTAGGFAGLDTQVTSEVDVSAKANFGKLQLLDSTCGGTTFATTGIVSLARTTAPATFPTTITWVAGQPATGTVGLLAVNANPAECIVYQVVVNNPLTVGSIPAGASITDTMGSGVTFVSGTGVGKAFMNPLAAGTAATSGAPGVTAMAAIVAGGTVTLQYEAKVN